MRQVITSDTFHLLWLDHIEIECVAKCFDLSIKIHTTTDPDDVMGSDTNINFNTMNTDTLQLILNKEHYYLIKEASPFWINYQSEYKDPKIEEGEWEVARCKK